MACEDVDCQQVIINLGRYVDRELSDRDRGPIMIHLRACEACGQKAAEIRRLAARLESDLVPAVPADAVERILNRARSIQEANRFDWDRVPLVPEVVTVELASRANYTPRHAIWAGVIAIGLFGLAIGMVMSGQTWTRRPSQRISASAGNLDPMAAYGLGVSAKEPRGSLAEAYVSFVSGRKPLPAISPKERSR